MIVAESQLKGRGRLGRTWTSPPGKGLLFSVILRPGIAMTDAHLLTLTTGDAVAEAIEAQAKIPVHLKWPNDLIVDNKKAGGILLEVSGEQDRVDWVVAGIGINVNVEFAELPVALRKTATSLKMATDKTVDRSVLLAASCSRWRRPTSTASRTASSARCASFANATICCTAALACRRERVRWSARRPASTTAAPCLSSFPTAMCGGFTRAM